MAVADLSTLARHIGRTVREHRMAQGLSIGDLGRTAGLSKTIVSRIESGLGNPSVETLWRITTALSLPLGALLEPGAEPRTRVIRAGSGEPLQADSGMLARLLHADGRARRSEVYDIALPAGTDQRTDAHLPGTEEVVVCVSGRVLAGPLGEEAELGPGDAVWFGADVAHRYHALEAARTLCWMLYG